MASFEDLSVLIVDDEESMIGILSEIFEGEGVEVSYAMDGETAVETAQDLVPDLILLDIGLPDISGFDVCERIREEIDVPILFMTGMTNVEHIRRAFESGGADYVTKPIHRVELLTRIDNVLTLKNHEEELQRKVEEKTSQLREKNTALEEVIEQFESRVSNLHDDLYSKLERRVISNLDKLKAQVNSGGKQAIEDIKQEIDQLFDRRSVPEVSLPSELTPREREICDYIREGLSTKEIADVMNRSAETIKSHRSNIREKLDLTNSGVSLANHLNKEY